jgi:transposase
MKNNWFLKNQYIIRNGKKYDYYSIVEPYREGGKNRHRIILRMGRLTPLEAQIIMNVLKATKSPEVVTVKLENILFEDHWRYLDLAFLNHLWDGWGLSHIFPDSERKDIPTANIAKILTFYRCLDPGSYLSTVEWFKETACDLIFQIKEGQFNGSRIYRELTEIDTVKENIEQYLYETLKRENEESLHVVFYDLSDSYFEGRNCKLARPGHTKNNGFKRKKIVLSLLVNSQGYPFSWNILKGDTADVKTLKGSADNWRKEFGFSTIILVFDRGMVSDDNLKHLEGKEGYLYITALDKDQISGVKGVDTKRFKSITEKNVEREVTMLGFKRYDDRAYYEDLGVVDDRRYILIFNPGMFKEERENRDEHVGKGLEYLKNEKRSLLNAGKSRRKKATEKRIDKELDKLKVRKYIEYNLDSMELKTKKGNKIKSFRIEYGRDEDSIKEAELVDGLWMLVTNIREDKVEEAYRLNAEELISAYRDKNRVEEAFKEVKSFIRFQPSYVYTDEHIRAHYTICILSYLLNMTITNKLREHRIEGVSSVRAVYRTLKRCRIGSLRISGTKHAPKKIVNPKPIEEEVLKLFECKYLTGKQYLSSIGI